MRRGVHEYVVGASHPELFFGHLVSETRRTCPKDVSQSFESAHADGLNNVETA